MKNLLIIIAATIVFVVGSISAAVASSSVYTTGDGGWGVSQGEFYDKSLAQIYAYNDCITHNPFSNCKELVTCEGSGFALVVRYKGNQIGAVCNAPDKVTMYKRMYDVCPACVYDTDLCEVLDVWYDPK